MNYTAHNLYFGSSPLPSKKSFFVHLLISRQIAKLPANKKDLDVRKAVEDLAIDIFVDQQSRITKNVMLKVYDYFMVKL